MSSYRRYVARHGAAIYRAKRQVRKHALETGPAWPNMHSRGGEEWAEETFQDFARKLKDQPFVFTVHARDVPDHVLDLFTEPEPDLVLAYRGRASKALRCVRCVSPGLIKLSIPLTSDDLPDGGICRACGVDVLIPVVPNPCCTLCEHAPHGGEAGCHCGCRGTR